MEHFHLHRTFSCAPFQSVELPPFPTQPGSYFLIFVTIVQFCYIFFYVDIVLCVDFSLGFSWGKEAGGVDVQWARSPPKLGIWNKWWLSVP